MSRHESKSNTSDWTGENLKKLLAAMKTNIQKQDTECPYTRGLKAIDWTKVAFPPFSSEECQEKWGMILQKMRKTRTLTELIVEAEGAIANPLKRKKIHPEVPKKPCPPNAIFYEENWAKFQEKHPNMKKMHLIKLINQKFKELSENEKEQYEKKHKLAMKEYNRRMQEFREQYGNPSKYKRKSKQDEDRVSLDTSESKPGAEDADGLPPRPPFSGYNLFCKEELESMTHVPKCSHFRICAQRWRDLTASQRNLYKTRCHELKQQHSVKLHEILMSVDKEQQQRVLQNHGLKRSRISPKNIEFPDEPQMPPRASNINFFKKQMKSLEKEFPDSKERFSKVSQKWMDLSVEEKKSYSKMATEQFMKYKVELQKWFQKLSPEQQGYYLTHNPRKREYLMPTLGQHAPKVEVPKQKHVSNRPSDSEDEDIEDSSTDEEYASACEEDEEEEEEGEDITFEMF